MQTLRKRHSARLAVQTLRKRHSARLAVQTLRKRHSARLPFGRASLDGERDARHM